MKKWLWLPIFLISCFWLHAETEQPIYEVQDQAISENFRTMSYTLDQHRHNNDGSARPYDLIPDTGSTYGLGAPLTRWATVYADRIEFGDGTRQTTASSGSGGGSSTFTFRIQSGGDVLLATTPFTAIPGMSWTTGRSTWTATIIRAFSHNISTTGSTFYQIARTTGANNRSAALYTYMTHHIVVPTNTFTSSWDTGTWIFFSTETYAVHITSIPQIGQLPSEFGIQFEAWK